MDVKWWLKNSPKFLKRVWRYVHPRDNHLIVYGGVLDLFIDNAKYMFILNNKILPDYKHVWLTNSETVFKKIKTLGFDVVLSSSKEGRKTLKKAGFVIFDDAIKHFANPELSWGAKRIELWHGIHGKMSCRAHSENQPVYKVKDFLHDKITDDHAHGDYCVLTSEYLRKIVSYTFGVPFERMISSPYPRNWILTCSEAQRTNFVKKYEDEGVQQLYDYLKNCSLFKIIYMPTFRDADRDYLSKGIPDWNRLNEICRQANAVLYLKVHRITSLPNVEVFSNIKIIDNKVDVYTILSHFDMLITDYSSVCFDFALTKKSIVLYTYDKNEYMAKSRPLHQHFLDLMTRVTNVEKFESLLDVILNKKDNVKPFPVDCYFDCPNDYDAVSRFIRRRE